MRLVELSRGSGLQNATVLRILGSLQHRGLVATENGLYRLGRRRSDGAQLPRVDPLIARARPVLQQLAGSTGLTASLYARIGDSRILTVPAPTAGPLRQLPLGRRLPLHVGAGKNILAALPEDERDRILEGLGDTDTAAGERITARELREQLEQVRRDGFHISINERETGVAAVSVPLGGAAGDVIAAISASGPLETTPRAHLEAQVPELRRAANALQR